MDVVFLAESPYLWRDWRKDYYRAGHGPALTCFRTVAVERWFAARIVWFMGSHKKKKEEVHVEKDGKH
jgi:hypothetical protein